MFLKLNYFQHFSIDTGLLFSIVAHLYYQRMAYWLLMNNLYAYKML